MARPKSDGETKSHQQHLLMAPSEIAAIDEWSFANRIRSRGDAIRRLCQLGLTYRAESTATREQAAKLLDAMKSVDFRTDEDGFPTDRHFDSVLALIEAAADMVTNVREVDAVARFLTDGEKPTAMDRGEDLRVFLEQRREQRAGARDKSDE